MPTHETFATRPDPVLVTLPDGCRIAARVFGPDGAPPVLFIAGGDGGMLQWRAIIPQLCVDPADRAAFAAACGGATLASDLRVAAFDARGTGWSSRARGVATTAQGAAADALALAGALFQSRFHLVGHGLGGAAALGVALAGPRLVASLTVISSTAGGEAMSLPGQEFFAVRAALTDVMADADTADLVEFVRRDVELGFTPGFVAAHPGLVDRLVAEAVSDLRWEIEFARRGAGGPSAGAGRGEQFATLDLDGRLDEVGVPTLVVHGSADVVLPLANGERLAERILGARMVTLDAGHAVTIECAADVAAAIRAHILFHP